MVRSIISLFRGKPRKARANPPAGRWPMDGAFTEQPMTLPRAAPAAPRQRPAPAPAQAPVVEDAPPVMAQNQGYLAAHGVEKSFAGRKVVKGVSLYVRR